MKLSFALCCLTLIAPLAAVQAADEHWVVYPGGEGPGRGKHIVLLAGDEEYRSEEALPMLGKILSQRHGFRCTVLFSIHPETGEIDPNNQTNIPGMQALETADMVIVAWRFRELPDEDMKYFVDYINAGKPILGLRTATHSFNYTRQKESPYTKYSFNAREWPGGFGQRVLGDTWVSHHGGHGSESTRGLIQPEFKDHPVLRGVEDIWGPTDVYGITHLIPEAQVLVQGQVLKGMKPDSEPNRDKSLMPLVWIKEYQGDSDAKGTAICTTLGASVDLECEDLRRLIVNACYWATGLEEKITDSLNVDYVGEYKPTFFGFNKFQRGVKPADHRLK